MTKPEDDNDTQAHGRHEAEPAAPTTEDGSLVGQPDPSPLAPDAPVAHVRAVEGGPDAARRWCPKCKTLVEIEGKGKCGQCGVFLRLNFASRRHPQNLIRVDHILAELIAEYQPATVIERFSCQHLASTLEQLESMRPDGIEWQRKIGVSRDLSLTLQEARASRTHEPRHTRLDQMSDTALRLLHSLTKRISDGEQLSPYEQGQFDVLRCGMYGVDPAEDLPPCDV